MSECTNERFRKMIPQYELGLLSESEREEFELHLFECDYCTEEVKGFENVARHLGHSEKVRESIRDIVDDAELSGVTDDGETVSDAPRSRWRAILSTSLAAAAVLVFLLVKPWQIEFRPTQEAIAAENRLAVMYFENLAGDDSGRLGEIVTSLLITDLSESQYMQVISSQQLYDILRFLEYDKDRVIDRTIAGEVAEKARAKYMIMGSVLQVEPNLTISAELVEVTSGDLIGSQRITAEEGEDIFALVDKLTAEIKGDLPLPDDALSETDRMVADVTTHSTQAYWHYLEGIESFAKLYMDEATLSFQRALEYDSTFAMAYYYLAQTSDRRLIQEAVKHSENASRKEKHYIRAQAAGYEGDVDTYVMELRSIVEQFPDEKEAYFKLGAYQFSLLKMDEAIANLEKAVEIDPLFKRAYNSLAYAHNRNGDFERALWAINKYIAIAPDEANPYDSRGDLLAQNGYVDRAIESYQQALNIKPNFFATVPKLGHLLVFDGQYDRADSCYKLLLDPQASDYRGTGLLNRVYIPIYQGRFSRAHAMLDPVIDSLNRAADEAGVDRTMASFEFLKALLFEAQGDYDSALEMVRAAISINEKRAGEYSMIFRDTYARILELSGRQAEADSMMAEFDRQIQEHQWGPCYLLYGQASVSMLRNDPQSAIAPLDSAASMTNPRDEFLGRFLLGRAYLESGEISKAVETFEEQLTFYTGTRLYWGMLYVKTHYWLGRAYEESRWNDKAAEQYEVFLDIWKDADSGIVEIEDARERLERLRS